MLLDDYITTAQSDEQIPDFTELQRSPEFVAEFNAYLDEMEAKHWKEMDARAN